MCFCRQSVSRLIVGSNFFLVAVGGKEMQKTLALQYFCIRKLSKTEQDR